MFSLKPINCTYSANHWHCIKSKVPVRPSWSIGQVKQRSPVSVANGIRGDCVASTMDSRLYIPQLRSGTHSELGQLRDTLKSQEKS